MHTHSSAALHKTHAMIIRISIWLLWHVGALLRLQCAVLNQTLHTSVYNYRCICALCAHTIDAQLRYIFSALLTLKSHLEIARFKDIYMDNTVIERVSQRFLQLKIWIVIKSALPPTPPAEDANSPIISLLIIVTVCSVLYRDYPYSFILKSLLPFKAGQFIFVTPQRCWIGAVRSTKTNINYY